MGEEEEFVPEEEAEVGPALVKSLREKLKQALAEKQEYLEGWQRARADFVNYKREEAGIHADREDRMKSAIIEDIIPLLDSLGAALKTPALEKADPELKKGINGIYQQFITVLKRFGVEQIGVEEGKEVLVGQPFDPYKHEALKEDPVEDKNLDHAIVAVHRSGYTLGEKIIRPAQVSVGVYTQK